VTICYESYAGGDESYAGPMGWGYRKRVKLLPGINLNIGRRGVGVSGGKRGARVSASSSGKRSLSLGLKGFFWRRKL